MVNRCIVAVVAVLAASALAAGTAQAEGGPVWIHGSGKKVLAAGEKITIKSSGVGAFKLKSSLATVECKKESAPGELIGGNEGTDKSTITFEECSLEKKSTSECGPKEGKIGPFEVKTVLGYPEGKAGGTEEAYDQFFPTPSETVFTKFELTGSNCGLLDNQKVEVVATGTKVTEPPVNAKCGIIAIAGKFTGTTFEKTISGQESELGGLEFPSPAITKEETWNASKKAFEKVTCGLESKSQFSSKAEQIGKVELETSPKEAFGWEI
jgi:hypothetical protein